MKPNLQVLPKAQQKIWQQLINIPSNYILYCGTAIALQLGHRESVDFDFFSSQPLDRIKLLEALSFLNKGKLVQPDINTLDCYVKSKDGGVKLQFLTGIGMRQGRVENPLQCDDNGIYVASLRDLLASKLNTIQMRAEIKDYIDIDALLQHGLKLGDGLGCAQAIFGNSFDPGTSIRALCSYRDGNLPLLPKKIQQRLTTAALAINKIPKVKVLSKTLT